MSGYYARSLSAERLRRCYELAGPRIRRYLDAEVAHVRGQLRPGDAVVELGCGYGRIGFELADSGAAFVGVDTAAESIALARNLAKPGGSCRFHVRDALATGFPDDRFDRVLCLQNGICAFGVDRRALVAEAVRICRPGGRLIFSTYEESFWEPRLEWFEAQSDAGLLGPIDRAATGDGVIACTDGFRSGLLRPQEFETLWRELDLEPELTTVDGSALFCEATLKEACP